MRIYTRTGDDGTTGLIGGDRVRKDNARVAAYGDIDETNAAIGAAAAACRDVEILEKLRRIQEDLFIMGTQLATPGSTAETLTLDGSHVLRLEQWIDAAWSEAGPLRNFVLPGGTPAAAALHQARTVCRRAERALVSLSASELVGVYAIHYANRLSDLLFALARVVNHRAGVADVAWIPSAK